MRIYLDFPASALFRANFYFCTTIRQNFAFFARFYWLYFVFWSFEFVSDFEFRISNFLAAALPRQVVCVVRGDLFLRLFL